MRMTPEMTRACEENAILYSHRHLELIAHAVAEEYGGGYEKAEEIVRSALGIISIYSTAREAEADDALAEIAEENEAWRDNTPEEDD